jgi:Domain of unknown function (DUF4062)
MNRKLQVFISSTFQDLRDERQAAVEGVLLAKHIPAGMELFTAGDASQLEVIKQWIKESDVYLLILGARYGSIEPESGLSYSEIEYDFAVASGMPYFALVLNETVVAHKHAAGLTSSAAPEAAKLAAFRKKVLSKHSKFVEDPRDIKIGVLQSLHEIEARSGLVGWLRSNEIRTDSAIIEQVSALAEANSRLRELHEQALRQLVQARENAAVVDDLAPLESTISLGLEATVSGYKNVVEKTVTITWRDLFAAIAIKLLAPTNDNKLIADIAREIAFNSNKDYHASVKEKDWETVKAQFISLGYVSIDYRPTVSNSMGLFWTLTDLGKQVGLLLRTVKRAASTGAK